MLRNHLGRCVYLVLLLALSGCATPAAATDPTPFATPDPNDSAVPTATSAPTAESTHTSAPPTATPVPPTEEPTPPDYPFASLPEDAAPAAAAFVAHLLRTSCSDRSVTPWCSELQQVVVEEDTLVLRVSPGAANSADLLLLMQAASHYSFAAAQSELGIEAIRVVAAADGRLLASQDGMRGLIELEETVSATATPMPPTGRDPGLKQARADLEAFFGAEPFGVAFVPGPQLTGYPSVEGRSEDDLFWVGLVGPEEDLVGIMVEYSIAWDEPDLGEQRLAKLLELPETVFPRWNGGDPWEMAALRASKHGCQLRTVVGDHQLLMRGERDGGVVLLSVIPVELWAAEPPAPPRSDLGVTLVDAQKVLARSAFPIQLLAGAEQDGETRYTGLTADTLGGVSLTTRNHTVTGASALVAMRSADDGGTVFFRTELMSDLLALVFPDWQWADEWLQDSLEAVAARTLPEMERDGLTVYMLPMPEEILALVIEPAPLVPRGDGY